MNHGDGGVATIRGFSFFRCILHVPILGIGGILDDEVSLVEWNAGHEPATVDTLEAADPAPMEHGLSFTNALDGECHLTASWRELVHRDDSYLSLIPCDLPRVASMLQDHGFDHF